MSLSAHSFTSDFTFSCVHSRASQSFADCREDLVLLGVKKHWSCCDASYCTGRRGAQGVCFKLLGLKRGFIFTSAATMKKLWSRWPVTGELSVCFWNLWDEKADLVFSPLPQPLCSSDSWNNYGCADRPDKTSAFVFYTFGTKKWIYLHVCL